MGLLSLAIWVPIAFGAVLLALGRDEHARAVRWLVHGLLRTSGGVVTHTRGEPQLLR